jgi:hypothetical protein
MTGEKRGEACNHSKLNIYSAASLEALHPFSLFALLLRFARDVILSVRKNGILIAFE